MRYSSKFGYVGIAVEDKAYVMEGINEAGLAAGLFYFPDYGEYMPYDPEQKDLTISDMQFVSWVLASFASIDELIDHIDAIHVVGIDPRASTVHWRITEPSGRQIVIEVMNGHFNIHENPLGVLTNSPSLDWHLSNLNNYINLHPGSVSDHLIGNHKLSSFSAGTGMLGLPGDMSSPSRFVRAAFLQTTAPVYSDSRQTVIHAFHLMNQFDIPIGLQYSDTTQIPDMHSATQVTIVTDIMQGRLYYKTMYNAKIRCMYLFDIDFDEVTCQYEPLDYIVQETIEYIDVYQFF
jgi:choloylglycine hydrolase